MKLTDELNGAIVAEAVFLKPKEYSIAYVDGFSVKTKQRAKGVNHEVKKTLHHEKFKSVLFNGLTLKSSIVLLTSKKLKVNINEVNKVALSPFDYKQFYLENGIDSYASGHHRTGQKQFRPVFTKTVSCDQVFSPNDSAAESSNNFEVGYQNDVHSESDSYCAFQPLDPGILRTAEISSDDDEILDWDARFLRNLS